MTTAATYSRTVTVDLPDYASVTITFRILSTVAIAAGVSEIFPGKAYTLALDGSGLGSTALPTPDNTGDAAWLWRVELPDNKMPQFTLAYAASSISLAVLLVTAVATESPDEIAVLISNKQDKDADAVDDNLAQFVDGQTVDSGIVVADVVTGLAAIADLETDVAALTVIVEALQAFLTPVAPTDLTAVWNSGDVDLAWTDNATNEEGYTIYRSINGVDFIEIADIAAGSASYTDTTSDAGARWYYVTAYNAAGEASSSTISIFSLDGYSNIVVAYSVRRLRTDYTGPLIRLRRDGDNAESDFGVTSAGDLDTAAIATWLAGANGYVTTKYDQGASARHLVQATADNQPLYVASGPNSRPTIRFDGVNDRLRVTFANVAAPHHIFTVAKLATWTNGRYIFDGGANIQMGMISAAGSAFIRMITGASGPLKDFGLTLYRVGVWYNLNVVDAHYARLNGSQTNVDAGVSVGTANISGIVLGCRGDETLFGNVDFSEFIVFNAEQINGSLEASMGEYYGITVA